MVFALLASALTWGAFAFGSVYSWAWPPLLAAASLAGITAWFTGEHPTARPLAAAALVTIAAVAVQLIPLDSATIGTISPGTDAILRQLNLPYAYAISTSGSVRHPISLAPAMTAVGLIFLICATTVTLGLSRWITRTRLVRLAAAITAIGGTMACIAIIQRAASPSLIYGFWRPYFGQDPFGPFVNKNHFAGWVLMGLPVALGLAAGLMARRPRRQARDWRARLARLSATENAGAMLAVFAATLMVIGLLMSFSRSGIGAAVAALLVALVLTTRRLRWPFRLSAIAGMAVMALIGLRAVDTERLSYRFRSVGEATYASRLQMWRDTARMVQDVPVVGVGIRAYTVASMMYEPPASEEHAGAAHSDWLQLAAEGGLLVGVPAVVLLSLLVREANRRFREHRQSGDIGTTYWIRAGAATGLLAICIQSLVEFALQMPGNTMLFAVLWAIVIAPTPRPVPVDTRPFLQDRQGAERNV